MRGRRLEPDCASIAPSCPVASRPSIGTITCNSSSIVAPTMTTGKSSRTISKPTSSPATMARRALLKRIQRRELRKLQLLIPSSLNRRHPRRNSRRRPDTCTVIDQAIRYIDQLHATVIARVQAGSLPPDVIERLNLPAASHNRLAQLRNYRVFKC